MGDQQSRYCHGCRHALRGLEMRSCPECGRPFDPDDPRTTSAHPVGDLWRGMASFASFFTICAMIAAVVVVAASAQGVPPLGLAFVSLMGCPLMLVLFVIVLVPVVPIRMRTRVAAIASLAVIVSAVLTSWPFHLSFLLHRGAFDQCVDDIHAGVPVPDDWIGAMHVNRVRMTPAGNIGFQLTGDSGGGTYLVHVAPGSNWVWWNTNWEKHLGGPWYLVEED